MLRAEGKQPVQGRRKHVAGKPAGLVAGGPALPRADPENDIEAYIVESCFPYQAESLNGRLRIVPSAHPAQNGIVERLHPHAQAVYAELAKGAQIARATGNHVVGVYLDGKFFERPLGEVPKELREKTEGHNRRRAPSDVEGIGPRH